MTKPWYREQAEAQYGDEGQIEIDDNARVSKSSDGGAYVQAWVWVENPVCAECRDTLTSMRGVVAAKDGALFHGRCWRNA